MASRALNRMTKGPFERLKFGTKEIYLPKFTIALLRSDHLPPTQARFLVPLNFNKFDLRDYLYHVYGIKAINIRSFVQQQKVQMDERNAGPSGYHIRRWFRPKSIKKMTVEMESPFVWPEVPEDLSPWDKETYDAAHDERQKEFDMMRGGRGHDQAINKRASVLAEQAKELLEGKRKWKPSWVEIGEVEVERNVDINQPRP